MIEVVGDEGHNMARVLVSGDSAAVLDVLCAEITGEGHEVIEAYDGQQAYEFALSERPDMMFLQVAMPVFDGYETCQMLRQDPDIPAGLPVILVVGAEVDPRKIEKVGATDMLAACHEVYEVRDLLAAHLTPDALTDVEA